MLTIPPACKQGNQLHQSHAAMLLLISDRLIYVADQQHISNSFQQQNNLLLICH
ncbi:hypothetical protein Syun_012858 [Stephania yunnanensis]|uniref:Uncharacterized protein n=1 Tax=Stephania yunnanensis TaxID=152371 RepID=A0AAP0K071_9MAGN